MSSRSTGTGFASSMASGEADLGQMPIISLLKEIDAYAVKVFDKSTKTIDELQRWEKLKRDIGEPTDSGRLEEREVLLTGFLPRTKEVQEGLREIARADFAALSLVWGNGDELVGQALHDTITLLADIERQVLVLRKEIDGRSSTRLEQSQHDTNALLDRLKSLMVAESSDRGIRHQRDIHPCRGALQLIKGDDRGGIDRCLRKDLNDAEHERLDRGGARGTFLFWKCDSCEYRRKYFVSRSRAASLLSNNDHLKFKGSKVRCSQAFLAMSHLERRERKPATRSRNSPKYTCLICVLHRPAARPGRAYTFSKRDDYAKHLEATHIHDTPAPAFVLQKLGIDHGNELPDGSRREMWTV